MLSQMDFLFIIGHEMEDFHLGKILIYTKIWPWAGVNYKYAYVVIVKMEHRARMSETFCRHRTFVNHPFKLNETTIFIIFSG